MINRPAAEFVQSGAHSARALVSDLTLALHKEQLSDDEVFKGVKTVGVLLRALHDECGVPQDLQSDLDDLLDALTMRLGEAIDGRAGDRAYDLGRAIDIVAALRRKSRRRSAGARLS